MSIYCEEGVGALLTQPINSLSNAAFFIAAYFAYRLLRKEKIKSKILHVFPFVGIFIGIGSSLWHAIPHPFSDFLDVFSISLFAALAFFYLLSYLFEKRTTVFGVIALVLLVELPFIFDLLPTLNGFLPYFVLLASSFGIYLLAGERRTILTKPLGGILCLFIVSLGFRTLDLYFCQWIPFGSHFMWHILDAVMTYYMVKMLVFIEKQK